MMISGHTVRFRAETASLMAETFRVYCDGNLIGSVRHAGRASWEATTSEMKGAGMHRHKRAAAYKLLRMWKAAQTWIR